MLLLQFFGKFPDGQDLVQDGTAGCTDAGIGQEGDDEEPQGDDFGIEDESGDGISDEAAQDPGPDDFSDDGAPDGICLLIQKAGQGGANHAAGIGQDGTDAHGDADG